jgi:hypothetical protein
MSSISRWSYLNTATVRPFVSSDDYSGVITYGDPYDIACTWAAESKQMRDATGAEFVSNYIIWSEDVRPKHRDLILLNTEAVTEWQEIKTHMQWDMAMFGDTPDYRTVT